ncbi:MAG: arginase [Gammaproteobacteria bacterium]
MTDLQLVGAALGIGGLDKRSVDAADAVQRSQYFNLLNQNGIDAQWLTTIRENATSDKLETIHEFCKDLANTTEKLIKEKQKFCVIGGDHSLAVGTWSGVEHALEPHGSLGLIWIDAHKDAHTFETSETGNIHGMPVASLLGHGDDKLTKILSDHTKLKPENLCIIGARCYELAEHELLESLNVKVYHMPEVLERGVVEVLEEARQLVSQNTAGYGISLDLDGIDPEDAPGVGTPEEGGIPAKDLLKAFSHINNDANLVGFEIVEYNPHLDIDHKTEKLIIELIAALTKGKQL